MKKALHEYLFHSSGAGIRTYDLRVMRSSLVEAIFEGKTLLVS